MDFLLDPQCRDVRHLNLRLEILTGPVPITDEGEPEVAPADSLARGGDSSGVLAGHG